MAERMELTRPVFFVGFMGAGKTSVARRLARTINVPKYCTASACMIESEGDTTKLGIPAEDKEAPS